MNARPSFLERTCLGAALALLGLAAAATSARAQGGIWSTIPVPGGAVHGVADADSGRVVIAGNNAAWRFDGFRMRRLPIFSSSSDSLVGTAILGARNGDTWFGTNTGAYRLKPAGVVDRFDAMSGLGNFVSSDVTCLAEDVSGAIWVGTSGGGVSRFDGSAWSSVTTDQGLTSNSIAALAVDPVDQSIWAGTIGPLGGLAHVVNGTVARVYQAFSLTSNRDVRSVIATPSGRVWFGTGAGIGRIEDGTLAEFSTSGSAVSALAEGGSGEIWFGTLNRGIGRLDDGRALFFPSGPPSNSVQHLFADAAGVLWVSTNAGLGRYEGASWLPVSQSTGQPAGFSPLAAIRDRARDAAGDSVDARGVLWLGIQSIQSSGVDNWTLARRVRGGVRLFGTADGLPGGLVDALAAADSGRVWVGSFSNTGPGANPGLALITLDGVVRRVETTSLPSTDVFALARAGASSVWAGTRSGVALVDAAGVHALPIGALAVPNAPVRGLDVDPQGRLWIATGPSVPSDGRPGQGAVRFDPADSSYLHVTIADGLPTNNLNSVAVFETGDVWFASGLGAVRSRGGALVRFTTAQGLPSNIVYRIAEGPNGEAWFATASGLAQYDGENMTIYTVADGMSSSAVANVFADSLGVVASLKTDGASLFHVDRTPPRAEIFAAPPAASGSQDATFGVRAGDLESGARGVLISFQLDSRPPSPFADDVTSAVFNDLPDGDHTFRLWAKDRALNVTAQPEVWNFTVDATAPRPIVEQPAFNSIVKGTVPVIGSVADERFAGYTIELRPQGREAWDTLFVSSALPALGDTLYRWDTTAQIDGVWELRVGSTDSLGLSGYVQVTTIVDNLAPSASVTAPAKVDHVQGGHVFTTLGELAIDIPPNAYEADQILQIEPIPALPGLLPAGASWASGWFVHAADMTLAKPATLTVQLSGVPPGAPVAFYRMEVSGTDTTLVPLGGARAADGLSISTTIVELGRFVVLYGAGVGGGAGFAGARGLELQPRVISPNGGGFDTRLAISFDVGTAGQGAIKVFDRAGRLVREVVEDGAFAPGRNVVFWDGRDGDGRVVASGLYMVAVKFDGGTQVASVAVANR